MNENEGRTQCVSATQSQDASRPPAVERQGTGRPWYRRRGRMAAAVSGLALALALAVAAPLASSAQTASSAAGVADDTVVPGGTTGGDSGWRGWSQGSSSGNGYGRSGQGQTDQTQTQSEATTATSKESTGIVIINTDLKYSDESAAGTGMVLTSDGTVLTNNHVVEGATRITVTVPSTGRSYTAKVVGTDTAEDVALLKLGKASGLTTITEDKDAESVGQEVTAVGNAEGKGVLMAASGEITALKATVTTASEGAVSGESLDGMIQISADVVSGDSGGALLDADGEVVGMTTAASSGTANVVAYAIPIENAMKVVAQIRSGKETDGVTLGYPAFLGVEVASDTSTASYPGTDGFQDGSDSSSSAVAGAQVAGVIDGTPAAAVGLEAGDTITAVGGKTVSSASDLSKDLAAHDPGSKVTVTWIDTMGSSHTETVTLATGPAA